MRLLFDTHIFLWMLANDPNVYQYRLVDAIKTSKYNELPVRATHGAAVRNLAH
ncbi:hypothetical protein [Burkholderia ubonensis]|uniref:hypothetical protein n=1 Tax=Burkholderia ubonensis TaxID=101571 RepID=UPI000A53E929|nr:hypothetical protein [Burkholderia ubonensis]